jgi:hypothetical protein
MAAFATMAGQRIVTMDLDLPLIGAWVADMVIAVAQPLATNLQPLVLGNLQLQGTVYRQSAFAGLVNARVVAGGAGWNKTTEARGYNLAGGVTLSMVLGDIAAEIGETVNVVSDTSFGNHFMRLADTASNTLRAIAGPIWWIDSSGVTQVGPRPAPIIRSPFEVENYDGGRGELVVSTEDYASWIPGALFSGPTIPTQLRIATVRHEIDNSGKARMHVLVR